MGASGSVCEQPLTSLSQGSHKPFTSPYQASRKALKPLTSISQGSRKAIAMKSYSHKRNMMHMISKRIPLFECLGAVSHKPLTSLSQASQGSRKPLLSQASHKPFTSLSQASHKALTRLTKKSYSYNKRNTMNMISEGFLSFE